MVVVGVILPGVPTAPFLLFAVYFAARGWPSVGETLRGYPRLRAVLDRPLPRLEPREVGGMAAVAAVAVAVFLAIRPPLLVVLALELILAGASASRWLAAPADQGAMEGCLGLTASY